MWKERVGTMESLVVRFVNAFSLKYQKNCQELLMNIKMRGVASVAGGRKNNELAKGDRIQGEDEIGKHQYSTD